jgi:hypothetical protein
MTGIQASHVPASQCGAHASKSQDSALQHLREPGMDAMTIDRDMRQLAKPLAFIRGVDHPTRIAIKTAAERVVLARHQESTEAERSACG